MGMQDDEVSGGTDTITRYAIGARGIDRISVNAVKSYPLYDGHGNMVATLATNGTAFTLGNQRSYGAWGEVRQGASTGDPKGRYCANLGHKHDDESGLIYMRARYYEPARGRFVSEDPAMDGFNWYVLGRDNPQCNVDFSGKDVYSEAFAIGLVAALVQTLTAWGAEGLILSRVASTDRTGAIFALIEGLLQAALSPYFSEDLDGTRMTPRQFRGKLGRAVGKAAFVGMGIGIAAAFYYGMRSGQVVAELYYLDYET